MAGDPQRYERAALVHSASTFKQTLDGKAMGVFQQVAKLNGNEGTMAKHHLLSLYPQPLAMEPNPDIEDIPSRMELAISRNEWIQWLSARHKAYCEEFRIELEAKKQAELQQCSGKKSKWAAKFRRPPSAVLQSLRDELFERIAEESVKWEASAAADTRLEFLLHTMLLALRAHDWPVEEEETKRPLVASPGRADIIDTHDDIDCVAPLSWPSMAAERRDAFRVACLDAEDQEHFISVTKLRERHYGDDVHPVSHSYSI